MPILARAYSANLETFPTLPRPSRDQVIPGQIRHRRGRVGKVGKVYSFASMCARHVSADPPYPPHAPCAPGCIPAVNRPVENPGPWPPGLDGPAWVGPLGRAAQVGSKPGPQRAGYGIEEHRVAGHVLLAVTGGR